MVVFHGATCPIDLRISNNEGVLACGSAGVADRHCHLLKLCCVPCVLMSQGSAMWQELSQVQAGAVQTGKRCLTETQCSAQRLHHVRSRDIARGYRGLKNPVLSNFLEKA